MYLFGKLDLCHAFSESKLSGFYLADILPHSLMGKPLASYWFESLLIYFIYGQMMDPFKMEK